MAAIGAKKRKRIGIIYESFSLERKSGINVYVKAIYNALKEERDFSVKLLRVRSNSDLISDEYCEEELTSYMPDVIHNYSHFLLPTILPAVHSFINNNRLDIVHTQGIQCPSSRDISLIKKDNSKFKFILTQHGFPARHDLATLLGETYLAVVGREILRKADHVIVVNNFMKKLMMPYTGRGKISVIYNGVDTRLFRPLKNQDELRRKWKSKLGILEDKYLLLFVGRLSPEKNIFTLLRMMQLLDRRFKLAIVGDGLMYGPLFTFVKVTKIDDRVVFLGELPHREIVELYSMTTLGVSATLYEGFSLSVAEALACGVPVVCPRVQGVLEIVDDGEDGILIRDSRDYKSFAREVKRLAKNPELRREMGYNGRRKVERNFNFDNMINQTINIYRRVLRA